MPTLQTIQELIPPSHCGKQLSCRHIITGSISGRTPPWSGYAGTRLASYKGISESWVGSAYYSSKTPYTWLHKI